ncbi:unnamed protein product [Durusdinium trenchii]|uniref:Protein kinase domain-containing protein n=1 Tax=Durusdinium trenchii TaxID=1381693 RepID=A0ABP0MTB6_9DINO
MRRDGDAADLQESLDRWKADAGAALLFAALAEEPEGDLPGLTAWLASLKLSHIDGAARDWCEKRGMKDHQEVFAVWEEFADALQLRPLERHRLAKDRHRYRLLETIGSGATARVFRCCDHSGNVLAVKRIQLAKLRRQGNYRQIEEMLHQEIAIHLSLQHPKVVGLVDVIESAEELRLVMEFLGGGSMDDVLGMRRFLPETQASDVFRQIAEGLHYIHMRDIAHRDLKPENVLVLDRSWEDPNIVPQVKLADFGHSKVVDDIFTRTPSNVGTPLYMAPEAFTLETLDERAADLWSLGVLLFVILLGRCPFDGSGAELQDAIQKGEFSFYHDDMPPPSPDAQSLVRALVKLEPRRRATLDWCLIHRFVVGPSGLGRLLLRDGLAPEVDSDEMLEETYILPSLSEVAIRNLRQDLCKWMLKFRFSAMTKGVEVVAKYGLAQLADWDRIKRGHCELLEVMAYHTNAKRPATGNVLGRIQSRGAPNGQPGTVKPKPEDIKQMSNSGHTSGQVDPPKVQRQHEDEETARQRRLAARKQASPAWNFSHRSGAKPNVDGQFRAQEVALERARRQAFQGRAYRAGAEDLER